jgi:hypothetical protein
MPGIGSGDPYLDGRSRLRLASAGLDYRCELTRTLLLCSPHPQAWPTSPGVGPCSPPRSRVTRGRPSGDGLRACRRPGRRPRHRADCADRVGDRGTSLAARFGSAGVELRLNLRDEIAGLGDRIDRSPPCRPSRSGSPRPMTRTSVAAARLRAGRSRDQDMERRYRLEQSFSVPPCAEDFFDSGGHRHRWQCPGPSRLFPATRVDPILVCEGNHLDVERPAEPGQPDAGDARLFPSDV